MSYTYHSKNNDFKDATSESRNAEKVAEANRSINDLRSDVLRLKIMLQAMMEIMVEQGVDPDLINARIDEIMTRTEIFEPLEKETKPCPKCGRLILDNGVLPLTGTCLYCGATVRFPPKFTPGKE
ncbi:MAG: hypothetical protein IKF09_06460 [Clostridiales bacterium]|nr:hypothetical protein [Clostridiales bacterium]